ncbi:MAG: hypothetical protein F4Y88_07805 [Chloroflexi bacterium]|nr:hypothetical protein [Chloroflexota bacterium]
MLKRIVKPQILVVFALTVVAIAMIGCQSDDTTPTPVPATEIAAMVRDAVREVSSELESNQAEIDREEIALIVDSAVQAAATQTADEIAQMVDSAVQAAAAQTADEIAQMVEAALQAAAAQAALAMPTTRIHRSPLIPRRFRRAA